MKKYVNEVSAMKRVLNPAYMNSFERPIDRVLASCEGVDRERKGLSDADSVTH
jgi:hypothetical protein